ncbi:conserved hypothetical protein [Burkholderia sp. H160]|nr:conserved hypothetical protein [Burkholderia sp. H160]
MGMKCAAEKGLAVSLFQQILGSFTHNMKTDRLSAIVLAAASLVALLPCSASADDSPRPCAALKRIVAAAPDGFASLTPDDGKGVAQPYGDDAQCSVAHRSFHCTWAPHQAAGSNADALEAVAADIASCLPEATHDQNSPGRQHFYLGAKDRRTEITLTPDGSNRLRLVVSGG